MKCPFCGTDNPAGETFCANCGGYLDTSGNGQTTIRSANNQMTGPTQVSNSGSGGIGATTTGGGTRGGNSSTLTPSSQLQNGRYVVEKILGQGGMGAAVLARDTRVSNKHVVIKELISDESDPTQRQEDERNFEREVETLSKLLTILSFRTSPIASKKVRAITWCKNMHQAKTWKTIWNGPIDLCLKKKRLPISLRY